MAFKFEKLIVWQKAIKLTGKISELTDSFPKKEQFILTAQIMRAADSVALNIAEGSTGQSDAEFSRFLGIAIRSGIEVVCCLYVGKRRRIISNDQFDELYNELTELLKGISSIKKIIKVS